MHALGVSAPSGRSVNRSVRTCTECKQVKLRCDSRAKFPAPCSRCQTRGLQCVVDSSFRRTPARKRVEEMAKELEVLRNLKEEGSMKTTVSPDTQYEPSEQTLEQSGTGVITEFGSREQYQLGSCVLDRDTIVEIFKLFAALFYPHFPVLNPNMSIPAIYDTAPLLFWTVIVVTTCHGPMEHHNAIFEQLQEPYLAQLRMDILNAPVPLQTIQALIHITIWPLPTPRQSHDPSWLYCGIAMNAAMYMGLHRARPTQSLRSIGVPSGSMQARVSTWLGCFLASTSLGMYVGVSPSISKPTELATIENLVRTYCIPPDFAYQVMVHHALAKFTSVILDNSQELVSKPLLDLFDSELDSLRSRFSGTMSPRSEIVMLGARLHLYTLTIIRIQLDIATREILIKQGYSAALRIVYLKTQGLWCRSEDYAALSDESLHQSIPKNGFRTLILAAIFLLRFFALNINASADEQECARNHIALAQRYFKNGTGTAGLREEKHRAATLLEILSRQEPIDIKLSKLKIDDRMGASLVFDAITTGHELRHFKVDVEEQTSPPQDKANEQDPIADVSAESSMQEFNDYAEMTYDDLDQMDDVEVPLNFTLPQDLWGDSVWGMFGTFAPQG